MSIKSVDKSLIEEAKKMTDCLVLDDTKLLEVMNLLEKEFLLGLKDEEKATIKMLITYVRSLPQHNERGKYLALDLGGTNFRVILIDLDRNNAPMDGQTFKIADKLMTSDGELLFDFIADCIMKFCAKRKLKNIRIALGFTFSFPCTQLGLSQSRLNVWTKGFNCPNVVGKDVVKLLKTALKKKSKPNLFIDIVTVINDTTGTLMSCAHKNPDCNIGLIVGTGTNACYIEQLENIEKWPTNYDKPKQVVINSEWGAFGDNGVLDFVRTVWDEEIDNQSINKGRQKFEKMVSGMYLGEIVRHVLLSLIEKNLLFNGKLPKKLTEKNSYPTKCVSKVDTDSYENGFSTTKKLLNRDFKSINYTETDLRIIYLANNRVSRRAANLVASGCATLINHMKRKDNTIAYDGSVIRLHPHFKVWIKEKIETLLKQSNNESNASFALMLSEDGSGRGAAIVAAVSYRHKRPKIIKKDGKVIEIGCFPNKGRSVSLNALHSNENLII